MNRSLVFVCVAVVAASALVGCGGDSLEELPSPELLLGDSRSSLTVSVPYADFGTNCRTVRSDLKATVNGTSIPVLDPGAPYTNFDGAPSCHVPTFALSSTSGATLPDLSGKFDVSVTDGASNFTASFHGICDPRSLSVVAPTGSIKGGDSVTLAWSPASDRLGNGLTVRVTGNDNSTLADLRRADGKVTVDDQSRITFVMPSYAPAAAGSAKITVLDGAVDPFTVVADTCTGGAQCAAHCDAIASVNTDVTLAP